MTAHLRYRMPLDNHVVQWAAALPRRWKTYRPEDSFKTRDTADTQRAWPPPFASG